MRVFFMFKFTCERVYLVPIILEQQLFDPVGMQHLVIHQMPEHYKYRIMIKCLVHSRFPPLVG